MTKYKLIMGILSFSFSSLAFAGSTPVFNTDLPGGSGDWENNERYLKVECQIERKKKNKKKKARYRTFKPGQKLPKGYYCTNARGAWCSNKQTKSKRCRNMRVRWYWGTNAWQTGSNWSAGSTPWFDRDRPSGAGDFETIEHQLKAHCIFGGQTYHPNGAIPYSGYTCDDKLGAWCKNKDTNTKNMCRSHPVKIKYTW